MIDILSTRALTAGLATFAGLAIAIMSGFIVAVELRGYDLYVPMPRWLSYVAGPLFHHPWPALAIGLGLIVVGIVLLVRS
jgi:energy-converting hydrogenase Eha subunit A